MPVNLDVVKQRLSKLNGQTGQGNTDYKKLFFKPVLGEQYVRIVPAAWNKDVPLKSVFIHKYKIFKKFVPSLSNWGEKDPIDQLRKSLFEEANKTTDADAKKETLSFATSIRSDEYRFVPVIVRGQESEGVKLWRFTSADTEKQILNILEKQKVYGDVTDPMDGCDLLVEGYTKTSNNGKLKYTAVNITPLRESSPLSKKAEEIEKWLTEQKDPLTLYKKYSFEEIKKMFKDWLEPKEDNEDVEVNDEADTTASVEDADEEVNDTRLVSEVPFHPDDEEEETIQEEVEEILEGDGEGIEDEEPEPEPIVVKPVVNKKPQPKPTAATKKQPKPTAETGGSKKTSTTKVPETTMSPKQKFDKMFEDLQ